MYTRWSCRCQSRYQKLCHAKQLAIRIPEDIPSYWTGKLKWSRTRQKWSAACGKCLDDNWISAALTHDSEDGSGRFARSVSGDWSDVVKKYDIIQLGCRELMTALIKLRFRHSYRYVCSDSAPPKSVQFILKCSWSQREICTLAPVAGSRQNTPPHGRDYKQSQL